MQFFIFILGILASLPSAVQSTSPTMKVASNNSFFIPIQQDSTPPVTQKGVVKIKNLENPKQKKQTTRIKKTSSKKPKSKEYITLDNLKTPPAYQKGLSTEEEIKLLSRRKSIDAENKIHPDSPKNCRFAFDVIDEFTGVQKRGLDSRLFFAYTPNEYRKFIQSNDFIRCEGFLSQSSTGSMALNINLSIASREAKQKFGAIKANSAMIIRTMTGKEYYIMTYPGAAPQVVDNRTHYQCSFAINKSDLKHLKKAEIDQVKISFQKGFQTYDVFYLDFLIDQFPCFEE